MNILGIEDGHESGAALLRDGRVISAINEERLNRVKLSGGFPENSIIKVLELSGLNMEDIDVVAIASKMTPAFVFRMFRGLHKRIKQDCQQFSYALNLYLLYQAFSRKLTFPLEIESWLSSRIIKKALSGYRPDTKFICIEHHFAHACAAFKTSDLKQKVLIFTIDGFGDGITLTVNIGFGDGRIKRLYAQSAFSAISTYYSRITEYLGFKPIQDEGKIMALAAYGDDGKASDYAHRLLAFNKKGFKLHNYFQKERKDRGIYQYLKNFSKEDIAAAFQKNLEEEVCRFVSYWIKKTDICNLALGGGLFANVKLNQRIHALKQVDSVYIFPHMGDGGLPVGAALACGEQGSFRLDNLYFGPEYSDAEIERDLENSGLRYEYINNIIEEKIAGLLAEGKVVGRFCGKMEFGPRALGNRSILYQATDPTVNDWLNKKLRRTEFMPFAPATMIEYADQCYLNVDGATYTARFMNIGFDCTEEMKKKCPGAVHIDGTARPQFVHKEDNPGLYRILDQYHRLTGIPAVINTSFNMHEKPIVCSPEDAIKVFQESNLDYLAMGNYLVKGKRASSGI